MQLGKEKERPKSSCGVAAVATLELKLQHVLLLEQENSDSLMLGKRIGARREFRLVSHLSAQTMLETATTMPNKKFGNNSKGQLRV